jgi:diacylglycerol kinase family enzyme
VPPAAASALALIANPASGAGTDPESLAAELRRLGARVELFEPGQAEAAAGSGAERMVVAGGDGSVAPAAAAAGSAGVPLAVIPVGTANDFARSLGLPRSPADAMRLAVEGTSLRRLDLGRINGRPFVNAASAGLAAQAATEAGGLKKLLGPLAYALGALLAGVRERPLRCDLRLDGEGFFAAGAWQVTVAGTGSFGAGSRLESAAPDDGRLDVAVIEAGSRLRLVAHAYSLRVGRLTRRSDVRHARARTMELLVAPDTAFNVDGEVVALGSVKVDVEPGAFELVVR